MPHPRVRTKSLRDKSETFLDLPAQPLHLLNVASWVTPANTARSSIEQTGKMIKPGASH